MTEMEINNFLDNVTDDLHKAYDDGLKSGAIMMTGLFEDWVMKAETIDDIIGYLDDFKRRNNINGRD